VLFLSRREAEEEGKRTSEEAVEVAGGKRPKEDNGSGAAGDSATGSGRHSCRG
jgi:hypothetical protein